MDIHHLAIEMQVLERRLALYEEKYGIPSADFHTAFVSGELTESEMHNEKWADLSLWKGVYDAWLHRKAAHSEKTAFEV